MASSADEPMNHGTAATSPAADRTIAVLPFQNTGASKDDVLVDELTDDFIDTLSMTRGLKVRPRSMVMRHLAEGADPRDLGRALDVEVVVEGSVRRAGDDIRVTARLISVADGFQLWAKRFDRPARDLLVVNDEAAHAVAAALVLDLAASTREPAADAETLEIYLRARHALRRAWSGVGDVVPAITLFEQGLARAPGDAAMLSGYAMACARALNYARTEVPGEPERTRAVVERAIAAAPHLGEPWLARSTLLYVTGDWPGAVKALRATLDRVPGLLKPRKMLGAMDLEVGRLAEGLSQLEAVVSLDPTSVSPRWELARGYALLGRWDRCRTLLDLPVEHEQDRVARAIVRARLDLWRREPHYPMPSLEEATTGAGRRALTVARIFGELVRSGALSARAAAEIERMPEETGHPRSRFRPLSWQLAAELFAFGGDRERTERAVARAVEATLFDLAWLDRCPALDQVRDEPWFQGLHATVEERVRPVVEALASAEVAGRAGATSPPPPSRVQPSSDPSGPAKGLTALSFVLRRDGDYFTVEHAGRAVRLRASVGLDLLARLVERPGQDLPALVLAAPGGQDLPLGDSGGHLDAEAVAAYRDRLEELREVIEEAEELGDRGRASRAREEAEALTGELARGLGLGGKIRVAGSAAERARINVQRHIRKAIRKIGEELPDLGRWLDWTVKTGTFCSYRPPE